MMHFFIATLKIQNALKKKLLRSLIKYDIFFKFQKIGLKPQYYYLNGKSSLSVITINKVKFAKK